jgi:hypothetical protein
MWAFNIVSSRQVIFNNSQESMKNPNSLAIIAPLLDHLNHSFEPNCVIESFIDQIEDQSYIVLKAIREIEREEQLTVSYGDLSNLHMIQKYGFTLKENPNNVVNLSIPYYHAANSVNEERKVKEDLLHKLGLPGYNNQNFNLQLYANRFDQKVIS